MTDWILSPINLVMILITQLIKEMGMKSLIVVGELTFGVKVINELFIACRFTSPLKKSKHGQ
jgi:hypothetical protein